MPSGIEVLFGLALAIVPGFIAVTVWARARTWRGPANDYRTTLESLALSLLIQILAAPLTLAMLYDQRDDLAEFPERVAIWALVVVLVIPVVGGISVGWVQDRLDVRRLRGDELSWIERTVATLQPPSAWDWLFTGAPPFGKYMVIAFDDGTRVAGVYASGSVAITSPQAHGLFLCPEWVMDDSYELIQELPGSAGIMVCDLTKVRWVRIIEGVTDAD